MAEQLTFHGRVNLVAEKVISGEIDFAQGRKEVIALLDPAYVAEWPQCAFDHAATLLEEAMDQIQPPPPQEPWEVRG